MVFKFNKSFFVEFLLFVVEVQRKKHGGADKNVGGAAEEKHEGADENIGGAAKNVGGAAKE